MIPAAAGHRLCPGCKLGLIPKRRFFCRSCWFALPAPARMVLREWRHLPQESNARNFREAIVWLKERQSDAATR